MKRAKGKQNVNVIVYDMFNRSIWKIVCLGRKSCMGNFEICGDCSADTIDPDMHGNRWTTAPGTSDINHCRACGDVQVRINIRKETEEI